MFLVTDIIVTFQNGHLHKFLINYILVSLKQVIKSKIKIKQILINSN